MKTLINSIFAYIKTHTAVVITAAAVVAAVGVGVGIFAAVRSNRSPAGPQGNTTPITNTAHEHVYTSEEIPATCAHGGYTLFSCECGDFYKENETPALDHEYGEWEVVQAATSDTEGKRVKRCVHCNETVTENIPEKEVHEHVYADKEVGATCTQIGYTSRACTICGYKTTTNEKAAAGHSWSSWKETKKATTTAAGAKERTCSVCGKKQTEKTPKISTPKHTHKYTSKVVEATCTKEGYTRHTCSCGKTYDSDPTPIRSHLYGDWKVITQATTTKEGKKEAKCERCGHTVTKTIAKLTAEEAETYEKYIDPRIKITRLSDGAVDYSYKDVSLTDTRSWGDPPSIKITSNGGFRVTYLKKNGSKTQLTLDPVDGYVRWMVIQNDGSYALSLIGDFDD